MSLTSQTIFPMNLVIRAHGSDFNGHFHSSTLLTGILAVILALPAIVESKQPQAKLETPVVYETLDGRISGTLQGITPKTESLIINDETLSIRDLLLIEFSAFIPESVATGTIHLRGEGSWNGRWAIRKTREADTLEWATSALSRPLSINIDALERYVAPGAPADLLATENSESDIILTREGAKLSGIIEEFTPTYIVIDEESLGSLQIEWEKVQAFSLVDLDDPTPDTDQNPAPIVTALTRGGSQPKGRLIELSDNSLILQSRFGDALTLSTEKLLLLRFENNRVEDLSDRTPDLVKEGLGDDRWFPWTWKKDRNVLNQPLSVGSRIFEKGLGVHSNSTLTFKTKDGDQWLKGFAGMDSSARPKDDEPEIGCAVFKILVDNKEVWNSKDLSWKDAPSPFKVDLKDSDTFSLVVEMGLGHHILDRANWITPRIFRR